MTINEIININVVFSQLFVKIFRNNDDSINEKVIIYLLIKTTINYIFIL